MLNKQSLLLSVFVAMGMAAQAQAQFYVSPEAEYFNVNDSRDFESSVLYGLAVGYQINDRVSLEAAMLDGHSDQDGNNADVNERRYRLDTIYNFSDTKLVPYIIGGIGENSFDLKGAPDQDNAFVTMGGGLKYALTNTIRLKTEARFYYNFESRDDTESGITAGIDFLFDK